MLVLFQIQVQHLKRAGGFKRLSHGQVTDRHTAERVTPVTMREAGSACPGGRPSHLEAEMIRAQSWGY